MVEITVGGLTFSSEFDSGNLSHVEHKANSEFVLWSRADCEGTPQATKSRTWFCFSVRGAPLGLDLLFDIRMSPQKKLYEHGMRPVYRSLPSSPDWRRVKHSTPYTGTREACSIRLRHTVDTPPEDTLYFAFTYPFSYTDLMARLAWLDALFCQPVAPLAPDESGLHPSFEQLKVAFAAQESQGVHPAEPMKAARAAALEAAVRGQGLTHSHAATSDGTQAVEPAKGQPVTECVAANASIHTSAAPPTFLPAGAPSLPVEPTSLDLSIPPMQPTLPSIRSTPSLSPGAACSATELAAAAALGASVELPAEQPRVSTTDEPLVYYKRELLSRSLDGRRVDMITLTGQPHPRPLNTPFGVQDVLMPHRKMVVLLTARVHPGETPAGFAIEGVIAFLLRRDDPRAHALRERFVFKLIPMLNPDGVYHGHYRSDTRGVNLNRVYFKARPEVHPSVAACLKLARKLHADGDLALFVDIHAHAGRRGCFFYGNQLETVEERVGSSLFAKLVACNTRWFDYDACDWFGGGSKDGSARCAVYSATMQQGQALPLIFTLECNYDSGVAANELTPKCIPRQGRTSPEPPPLTTISPKYTPASWQDIGKAIVLAMLDMNNANPASRIGPEGSDGLSRLRASVAASLQKREKSKRPPRKPKEDDSAGENEDIASTADDSDSSGL